MLNIKHLANLSLMKQTILFLHSQILKKSEVVSYITLPCDQKDIVGYIMWEND